MRRGPAVFRIPRQADGDQALEGRRGAGHREAAGAIGPPARDHFKDDRAEREQVGARIDRLALELFGRHVGKGAENLSVRGDRRGSRGIGRRDRRAVQHLREAEVEQLGVRRAGLARARSRQHHVPRFEVAMNHARAVRRIERGGNLHRAGQRLRDLHRALREARGQGVSGEELHDEVLDSRPRTRGSILAPDVIQGADVGVRQRRNRPGFALESAAPFGILGYVGGHDLDRDLAIEPRVARSIDFAHAAGADRREDFVGT